MLTFCDGKEPKIVTALEEPGSIFDNIIPHIKGNLYCKFNNSVIYSEETNDEFTQMFWKLGMKSFKGFIERLFKIPRKGLTKSKEVLKERQSLENSIKVLSENLQDGLVIMESIRQALEAIQNANLNVNAKKFTVTTSVTVWKTKNVPVGTYTTTSIKYNRTCHDNCGYGPGKSKADCCAIGSNGYYRNCPGKCHHTMHQNLPIIYYSETKEETVTNKDLEKRYYDNKSKLSKETQYINGLKNDFNKVTMSCHETQEQIKNNVSIFEYINFYEDKKHLENLNLKKYLKKNLLVKMIWI